MRIATRLLVAIALASLSLLLASCQSQTKTDATLVLTNAHLIDGRGGEVVYPATIEIDGDRITRVYEGIQRSDKVGDSTRLIDLDGDWVMPGLWNNHSHLADLLPDPKNTLVNESPIRATIRAGRNAMDALRVGFTSLRVVGESAYIDVAWRDAFADGVFVGPTIYASGPPIAAPDGHGVEDYAGVFVESAATVDDMRRAVLAHVEQGVDLVKIMVDELSEEQIRVAIETAHQNGIKIVGHAAEPGASIAVSHGIDGIEHGYFLTEDTLQMMAEQGIFYDPTIVCNLSAEYIAERESLIQSAGYIPDERVREGRKLVAYADERSPDMAAGQRRILARALELGVSIISGSDSNPIDEIGILEIEQIVFSGATEMQAILAATRNSAEMMGVLDEVGTVETGKIADLLITKRSPLDNISNLRSVSRVFKNGNEVLLGTNSGRASFWDLYFVGDE